jgi:hypothetical protein
VGQTRAQRLEAVALEGMSQDHKLVLQPMVRAMAKMIDEATKPKEKRAKDPQTTGDWHAGNRALADLELIAHTAVAWQPVQPRTVAALGKAVRELRLSDPDIIKLAQWLEGGGLSWMDELPTTSYIARHLADLVAKSRASLPKSERSALDRVREK